MPELTGSLDVTYPTPELVDIIDADGRTVATIPRAEMRGRRLLHRCVYVLVFNRHGELFVHLRTATKDVYPAHWDVAVGGVVLAGETFAQAADREAREELGVALAAVELFPFPYADAATVAQGMVFRAEHDGPFRLQTTEIVRGEFISPSSIPARAACDPFCPDGLAVLAAYQSRVM
jgi:isopentenyldiphosphate isomerase